MAVYIDMYRYYRRGMRSKRGFTLAEILAAVLLLSIALLAIMTADQAARDTQKRAVYLSLGRNIAQSIIEQLRAAPTDSLTSMTFANSDSSLPNGNSISVSVTSYGGSSENNLYQILVTVTWPESKGMRTIKYETLLVRS